MSRIKKLKRKVRELKVRQKKVEFRLNLLIEELAQYKRWVTTQFEEVATKMVGSGIEEQYQRGKIEVAEEELGAARKVHKFMLSHSSGTLREIVEQCGLDLLTVEAVLKDPKYKHAGQDRYRLATDDGEEDK